MKKIVICIILITTAMQVGKTQNVNWRSIDTKQKNLIYLNLGYDFGGTVQVGYGRSLQVFRPVVLSLDYSIPMGERLLDDFKVRYGAQMEVFKWHKFAFTAKVLGNFRRFENDLVRMAGFGTELSGLVGYYKPEWHIAAEFGYDKSIVSGLKHAGRMKEIYSDVKDGWYQPSGGHFFYGIQASKTVSKSLEASLRLGATNAEGNHEDPLVPFYAQLGVIKKF